MILGIDTASVDDNRNPSWLQAKAEGPISFAIIRAVYGTAPDKVFAREWPRIKEAGLVRGAYFFLRFPTAKAKTCPAPLAQAQAFIDVIPELEPSDLPPSLDVEFPGDGRSETGLSAQQLLDGVTEAWTALKDHYGAAPIIYTSGRVWKEDLQNLPAPELVESPLWLARYPYKEGPAVRDAARLEALSDPPVPPPWGDATNWWIHQYQGDAVQLPGFPSGSMDMNRFCPMFRDGESGERVKWVQRRLGVPVTGKFAAAAEDAVRSFQGGKGLVPDGIVGPRTFASLCWANP